MASSMWDVNHSPTLARLNLKRSGRKIGAWAARINNHNQWLRIDLGGPRSVKCVLFKKRRCLYANDTLMMTSLCCLLDVSIDHYPVDGGQVLFSPIQITNNKKTFSH